MYKGNTFITTCKIRLIFPLPFVRKGIVAKAKSARSCRRWRFLTKTLRIYFFNIVLNATKKQWKSTTREPRTRLLKRIPITLIQQALNIALAI